MTRRTLDQSHPPMAVTVAEVRRQIGQARSAGRRIGFVPTMGALHPGHRSLIDAAAKSGAFTVVSIYVNPTQFGPNEDLDAYPRMLEQDRQICGESGVDLIFLPSNEEMYPAGDQTRVRPGPLAEPLCGRFRPGHFEGVCTVVAKLFHIVQPDVAYFGQKDFQQALIIRRMVTDLAMPIRIEVCPIVREADGLAYSSRNRYLDRTQRAGALCLYHALMAGHHLLLSGEQSIERVRQVMQETITRTATKDEASVTIDYLTIVSPETLEDATTISGQLLLIGAVRIGETRLIDNLLVDLCDDRV